MNWIDVIILGIFGFYIYEGIRRGFIEQTFEVIGFFITVFLANVTYKWFAPIMAAKIGIDTVRAEPLAFVVMWLFFEIIYSLILRYAYPLIPSRLRNAVANKWAGLAPAFVKCFIITAVILTVIITSPVPAPLKSEISNSFLGSRFVNQSATVEAYINKMLGRDLKESLTFLTVPAQNEEIVPPDKRIDLDFETTDVTIDEASEATMLKLINQERTKAGLSALTLDKPMRVVARGHSRDMLARGFFGHENPDGLSPFDRMESYGVTFKVAGENIAYAPSVELAHAGFMRSPGHKANIMSADFGRIGIGIIDAGPYGKMFTQNFRD